MTRAPVDRERIRAYRDRFRRIRERDLEELAGLTLERKLELTDALMRSAPGLGWDASLDAEDAELQDRWRRIRQAYRERD